ncbi:tetratricopeptide repeat protein [Niabella ginsengisoli]|uniref:Tetratricopeptide repeat protein n=1 Tax=Niabella ginsengisoli TaxID=522298 RepID=A0ABS9SL77_9BACT|nr:tetratricopeptide repeat protein [Niabella ginsengisoli]MCH5599118.1 tetratricopeptide repeat protein [Niabella ginsengisoli]
MAGQHLEQYRHATYAPIDYYNEALKRAHDDIRCNNAKGLWLLRRGAFKSANNYLRTAVEKLLKHNPNPYDSEALYNLALCLKYQHQHEEAYDLFLKSAWSAAQQDVAYLHAAYIAGIWNNWNDALELSDKSILRNYNSLKARHLKAISLRKLGKFSEAIDLCIQTLAIDNFDFASMYELSLCYSSIEKNGESGSVIAAIQKTIQQRSSTYIEIANQYGDAGLHAEALTFLNLNGDYSDALYLYYKGYYSLQIGNKSEAQQHFTHAFTCDTKAFPNRIEDIHVLKTAASFNPKDYKALYYLGNFYYAKRLYDEARLAWEKAIEIDDQFPTTLRNLGIAYFNKFDKKQEALELYEKAFAANTSDARILFELDQLKKRFRVSPEERLYFLSNHTQLVYERDDLLIEFISLHTITGQTEEAYRMIMSHNFHPWEGGEGKVSAQYVTTLLLQAKNALSNNDPVHAVKLLTDAQFYPDNLGEGKIFGAQENDILYWLGCAYENKDTKLARKYWELASVGLDEPTQAIYYNDQQPDKIFYQGLALTKLGKQTEAHQKFEKLINYGKVHENDHITIDFFAVSLPDLMIFDDDLDVKNKIHCYYLMALGYTGLNNMEKAQEYFDKVLALDPSHGGAAIHVSYSKIPQL